MQFNADQQSFFRSILLNTRIISAALLSGVICFLIVVVFVIPGGAKNGLLLNTYAAFGIGLIALVISHIIPPLVGSGIKRALAAGKQVQLPAQFKASPEVGPAGNLLFLFQTRLIIGLAILEGAAFYNLVAYMLERQQMNLVMVGLLMAAMLVKFPTHSELEKWLVDEMKSIDDIRSLRR
jgi:hypothetical protein